MSLAWRDLPGPPAWPLIGNLLEFRRDILGFMRTVRGYGPVARFQAGPFRCVLLSEPALIQQALTEKAASLEREDALKTVARYLLGQGMVTTDGEENRRQRALGRPAMAAARLPDYLPQMDGIAEALAGSWRGRDSLELSQAMGEYSLRVAASALFGQDLGAGAAGFVAAMDRCMDALQPVPSFPPQGWWLAWQPGFRRDRALIHATVEGLLDQRRRSGGTGLFADMLLGAEAHGQEPGRSRDIALSVLVAGSETTAQALTWTLYLLSQRPELQAELRREPEAPLSLAVLQESMRLYPPVWMMGRRVREDLELGGLRLGRGELCYMSQFIVHRDARYYPEPERFDPARWTPAFKAGLPPGAWLPFGAGPRGCFGEGFALAELQAGLRAFLRAFEWSWPGGPEPAFNPFITLRPRGGLRLRIRSLEPPH